MSSKFGLILYYLVISKLPNSRYWKIFNSVRVWYVKNILKVLFSTTGSVIEERVYLSSGRDKVTIGEHCQINENVFIQGATIGNYVLIAPNVAILATSHRYDRVDVPISIQGEDFKPVRIEDNVWVGRNVIIMPGLIIGRGSIIGAGAVVTRDVHPYSVMGGIPAKLIRPRIKDPIWSLGNNSNY